MPETVEIVAAVDEENWARSRKQPDVKRPGAKTLTDNRFPKRIIKKRRAFSLIFYKTNILQSQKLRAIAFLIIFKSANLNSNFNSNQNKNKK